MTSSFKGPGNSAVRGWAQVVTGLCISLSGDAVSIRTGRFSVMQDALQALTTSSAFSHLDDQERLVPFPNAF